jgi:hypothetical protein
MIFDTTQIMEIGLGAIVLLLLIWVICLEIRIHRLLAGGGAKNLEDSLKHFRGELKDMDDFRKAMETYLIGVEKRLGRSIQSVHTVRFNPFKGTGSGGNQSFATALIDEKGDGAVLSTIYTREHSSIFAKPLKKHGSEYELTKEEKEAIAAAKKTIRNEQ